jgi:dTDP-4-dehydrorhamnose 3,5-epimerase
VIVDIRVGSPTFGAWDAVRLDEQERNAVYLAEGLGHGFAALTDDATVVYLCSSVYDPTAEKGLNPLDPGLAIAWPEEVPPLLSEKDTGAPSLLEARDAGLLPDYEVCTTFYESLRR